MSKGGRKTQSNYTAKVKVATDGPGGDTCSLLSFTDALSDVQQPALSKLIKVNSYEIRLDSNVARVYNDDGEACGTIVSLRSMELIQCMQKGKIFNARILELAGDSCKILVKPL